MLLRLPLLLAAALLLPGQTPSNLKARQVVDAAIAALGGDHYLQTDQHSGTGHVYTFNSLGELNDPGTVFWAWYRFPADERIELTKKRDVVYVYAGGKGWEITYKGVAQLLKRELAAYQNTSSHSLDVILKTWSRDPQTLMLYQGLNQVDQAQVESVLFTTQSGDSATVDFSISTHLPMRVSWPRTDPLTGGRFTESVVYGNWDRVGGIEAPFSLDHFQGPQKVDQRYFTSVSFAPFSDAVFTPAPLKH